jgi:hypothetical protein
VSLQTVKNWAQAGRFPLVRLGGRQFVRRNDLLRYLEELGNEQRQRGAAAQPPWVRAPVTAAADELPGHAVERAEALHTAMEAGRELSAAERAELTDVEQELAAAAAARLRDIARRARRRDA